MALLVEGHEGDVVNLDNALGIQVVELTGKWAVSVLGLEYNTAGFTTKVNLFIGSKEECQEYFAKFKKNLTLVTIDGKRRPCCQKGE